MKNAILTSSSPSLLKLWNYHVLRQTQHWRWYFAGVNSLEKPQQAAKSALLPSIARFTIVCRTYRVICAKTHTEVFKQRLRAAETRSLRERGALRETPLSMSTLSLRAGGSPSRESRPAGNLWSARPGPARPGPTRHRQPRTSPLHLL